VWRWRQLKGEPFFWVNRGHRVVGRLRFWVGAIFPPGHDPVIESRWSYRFRFFLPAGYPPDNPERLWFKCLAKVEKLRQVAGDVACIGGIFAGMILLYSFGYVPRPVPWNYFLCAGAGAIGAPLLFVFLKSRQRQTLTLGWLGIIILGFIPNFRFGLYHRGNDTLLMLPGPRVTLNTPSKAIDKIKMDKSDRFESSVCNGASWAIIRRFTRLKISAPARR